MTLVAHTTTKLKSIGIDCDLVGNEFLEEARVFCDRLRRLALDHRGHLVAESGSRLDPGIPIPEEASLIHGIRDVDVAGAPSVETFFALESTRAVLAGAQPAAYNAPFDRWFVPPWALADWTWPWLDTLTLVRAVDRAVTGPGRHRLEAACARREIKLSVAHRASDDARAAGELFHVLMPLAFKTRQPSIGAVLGWMRAQEAHEWERFHTWIARQPKTEAAA